MWLVDKVKQLVGIEQKKVIAEPVTDSELSQALNALAALESRVLSEAPKGKDEFTKIIRQFVQAQLKLKEFQESKRVGVPVAEVGINVTPGINARANLSKEEIELNEHRGAVRGLLLNIGIRINAFEKKSKPLAQEMRNALRYVTNKIAAEINMPQEHIKLAQSQGTWF